MSLPAYRLGTPRSPFNRRTDERWREYSRRKNEWIQAHPDASWRERDAAAASIARELELTT